VIPTWLEALIQSNKVQVGLYACPTCGNVWVSGMASVACPACQGSGVDPLDPVTARSEVMDEGTAAAAQVLEPPLVMAVYYALMIVAQQTGKVP
jgi:hypothetical protein